MTVTVVAATPSALTEAGAAAALELAFEAGMTLALASPAPADGGAAATARMTPELRSAVASPAAMDRFHCLYTGDLLNQFAPLRPADVLRT